MNKIITYNSWVLPNKTVDGKKIKVVEKTTQYEFCEDLWRVIKEFAGVYEDFPVELIDRMQKVGVQSLKSNCGDLMNRRFRGNAYAKSMRQYVLKNFFKYLRNIPKMRKEYSYEDYLIRTDFATESGLTETITVVPNYTKIEMYKKLYDGIKRVKTTRAKSSST